MPNRRKPISFDTTIRNPERIPQFISILVEFEGKIIDDEVALEIEAEIIRNKIYEPTKATLGTYRKVFHSKHVRNFVADDQSEGASAKVDLYFNEWRNSEAGSVEKEKIIYLLKNTVTDHSHSEVGWKDGWESRIHTQFNFMNELGLVRVVKGKKVKISDNGKMMIQHYSKGYKVEEDYDETKERSAFLNAFAKYQINNPYRKNTISVNFFPLVLNVIKYLDEKYDKKGISRDDIPFIITWGNNDYATLAEIIYKFRNKFGYNTSDEMIYEYAMNLIDDSTSNGELAPASKEFIESKKEDYKFKKIMVETPDEIIRKLRLTMLISLIGTGRFIDINRNEISKVEYILTNYSNSKEFENEDEYFEYMGAIDNTLCFKADVEETQSEKDIKEKTIENWANDKDWEFLKTEIGNIFKKGKNGTEDGILKQIKDTVRLEFLSAIIIKKALPHLKVMANYKSDSEGIPFNTASGQNKNNVGADIDVYENEVHALVEPTKAYSRTFQIEHELPSIRNHLINSYQKDIIENQYKEWFALFLAPDIKPDVGNHVALIKNINNVKIYPWNIDDFIEFSKSVESIKDYKKIRDYAMVQVIPE